MVRVAVGGLPLGVMEGTEYDEHAFNRVQPAQVYLAGTDGVWEMRNPAGEEFGKQRVQEIIRQHAGRPAAEISDCLRRELVEFRSSSSQDDDVTFVVVKVL